MAVNFRKAAVVGCGSVGASIAFRFLQQGLFSQMVLLDVDRDRAEGEATTGLDTIRRIPTLPIITVRTVLQETGLEPVV